jgi:hypothetical protein
MKKFTLLDFVGMSDEQLNNLDKEYMEKLNSKLANLKYDEELNEIYDQLDLLLQERKRRTNLDV